MTSINESGWSSLTKNALRRSGVTSIEEARSMTDPELLSIRNFGLACLHEVRGIEKPARKTKKKIYRQWDDVPEEERVPLAYRTAVHFGAEWKMQCPVAIPQSGDRWRDGKCISVNGLYDQCANHVADGWFVCTPHKGVKFD